MFGVLGFLNIILGLIACSSSVSPIETLLMFLASAAVCFKLYFMNDTLKEQKEKIEKLEERIKKIEEIVKDGE